MTECFYLTNALCALLIALYFIKLNNGVLRKLIIVFFLSLFYYQFSWFYFIMEMGRTVSFDSIYWYIANLPFSLSLIIFTSYIIYKWRQ